MVMSNDNSRLTIVLTTFNRIDKLDKLLNYYFVTKINYKIIISDCSKDEIILLNKNVISKYSSSLNIIHLIFPNSYCNYEAFYHGLFQVQTPFIVWSADDDFLIGTALAESVSFLEQNNEYVTAQGKQLFFTRKYNQILFGKSFMVDKSIESPSVEERIINSIEGKDRFYAPKTVYSVMRTDLTKKIYNDVLSLGLDHNNTEGLVNRLLLVSGKIKLQPFIYIVREHGEHNVGAIAKIRYTKIINNKYNLKSFKELNINETNIISDNDLKDNKSYTESIKRIKFLCVNYIMQYSSMDYQKATDLFDLWNKYFTNRVKSNKSSFFLRFNLFFYSLFFNLYPFGSVVTVKRILKTK